MVRQLVEAAFRNSAHEVFLAADGLEGLEIIERERPQVVFSDIEMPRLDGLQLADRLQAQPSTERIPIVFMTASVQRAQIDEAFQHHAAGVILKPFTIAELRTRVAEFLDDAAGSASR